MKAAIYERYGSPEVIEIKKIERPVCKNDELLVRVFFSTVNRTDTGYRSAKYVISRLFTGLLKPRHKIVGTEFAGEVIAIGRDVTKFSVGDRVFGYNEQTFGGCAEYTVIDESGMVAKIPDEVKYEEAAPTTEGGHYALGHVRSTGIAEGDSVLVYGASGGIGSATVQILVAKGVRVVAVCGKRNLKLLEDLGAVKVLDYKDPNWVQSLLQDGEAFDVVLDSVGKTTFGNVKDLLKPQGKYASTEFGPYFQNPLLAIWTSFFGSKKVLFPLPEERQEDVEYLAQLLKEGKYRAVIDQVYSLEDIVEATKYVESERKIGNVLIRVRETDQIST